MACEQFGLQSDSTQMVANSASWFWLDSVLFIQWQTQRKELWIDDILNTLIAKVDGHHYCVHQQVLNLSVSVSKLFSKAVLENVAYNLKQRSSVKLIFFL